jgi:hypothetical protein
MAKANTKCSQRKSVTVDKPAKIKTRKQFETRVSGRRKPVNQEPGIGVV